MEGFHQIALSAEAKPFTTFITHVGLFRFKRLPFGIACAPEIFQRVLSDILAGIPGVFVYVDDILITGAYLNEHDQRLSKVMARLEAKQVKLNDAKCQLRKDHVKYLGCILNSDGVRHDPCKIAAIQEMALPRNSKDVRRFLGMITYLGKFLPGLRVDRATASSS